MIAAVDVMDELVKVSITAGLPAVVALLWAGGRALIRRLDRIEGIVRHHLGPNGDTPPMWRRMERLEMAHDIETPAMPESMRARYPRDGAA